MLNKKLEQELVQQVNIELQSGYLYLSMSAYCDSLSLDGFGNWLRVQAEEELGHAMKIYKYLTDNGAKTTLLALSQPKNDFSSVEEVFETALTQEEKLAERFNALANLSQETRDNTTYSFLQWFLTEQVEEISLCRLALEKIKLVGKDGQGILMLDREFATRTLEAKA